MSGNQVRLANGQLWTKEQFLDHYLSPMGSPTPVVDPPAQVPVDMSWYMGEGPGRYYHPGMFKIITNTIDRNDLAPGAYDLSQLAPNGRRDDSVKASISNYFRDPLSEDYKTRALVFGNESARISGQVVVNQDGSKTFNGIEIRPFDTDFNFESKNAGRFLEKVRAKAREIYDPYNQGVSYDIPFTGNGRTYEPFTGSQLNAALRREAVFPGTLRPGLLPSAADSTPHFLNNYLDYLNEVNGTPALPPDGGTAPGNPAPALSRGYHGQPPAPSSTDTGTFASRFVSSANRNSPNSGIANWIAGLAGVDPTNPTQPTPQPVDRLRGLVSNEPMPDWPFPPPIFNSRQR
jgi:hypothetical protein